MQTVDCDGFFVSKNQEGTMTNLNSSPSKTVPFKETKKCLCQNCQNEKFGIKFQETIDGAIICEVCGRKLDISSYSN